MITKELKAEVYICEKCQKEYKSKSLCYKHESICDFRGSVAEVFVHDGKYTYPTIFMDSVEFYRMCMVSYTPADHHVWVYYNKQYTIGETSDATSSNNNYVKDCDAYEIMNRLSRKEFFDFCHETRSSRWESKQIPVHENFIHVKESSLKNHDIYVIYEKGDKIKVDYKDPDRKYGDGFFPIKKNNRIKRIEIFDKEILKKELIKSTHTLDTEMTDNLIYMKNRKILFEFDKCHYSVDEDVAREFLKKSKMDLSEVDGVITLTGRRVAHNTDDWLDIKTKKVRHFQGSRAEATIYGLRQYHGATEEEAILQRAFSKSDQRVQYSPQGRFKVGDLKVIMPDHHNSSYYSGELNFFNEDTKEPISHKEMLSILKNSKGEITVEYHE
jgi:hypothetical protein